MAHVLIIDDEPELRTMLRNTLESRGHDIEEASDGEEALVKCWTTSFNVVITDIKMPNLSGLSVISKLSREHPRTKIIAITGYDSSLLYQAQAIGASMTFTKPFSMVDIVDAVHVLSTSP